jgi:hypothetical protein
MKSPRRYAAVVILVGIIGLLPLTRSARFQAYHAVDVLQLLATGACFGVGFTLLFRKQPAGGN